MKLIHKTSRYYLSYTLFVLTLGTILFYFLIRIVLIDTVDEALHQEQLQIIENLKYEKIIDSLQPSPNIRIRRVFSEETIPEKFSTIELFDSTKKEWIHYRQLKRTYKRQEKFYEIRIRQSLGTAEALLASLLPAVAGLFVFILAGIFLINTYISNQVWKPFYNLLEKLKGYDLARNKTIAYSHSDITEFNELSLSVEKMTSKIYKDFLSQKEFNENSSHEMQTPVAIIRNKLELLIQSPRLTDEELQLIENIFDAVKRLTLLNKGLLLISKIENRQFDELVSFEMEPIVRKTVDHFKEQLEDKSIEVSYNILDPCEVSFNPILADILVTNLISNAIKHNIPNGKIYIELSKSHLKIENTGHALKLAPELLFERFRKNSDAENSIGLGLAIVKKITDAFGFFIQYKNEEDIHSITIEF